jgi:YVTN family beta-propeller protein
MDPVRQRAYVTNFMSNDVSVIGLLSNTVLTTLPVGSEPFSVAVSAPLALAYVTNASVDSISVIDTNVNAVVGTVEAGAGPLGVIFDLSGAHARVVNGSEGTVSVIDAASGTVSATDPAGRVPVSFGQFAGPILEGCGAASLACNDHDPFTSDSCAPSVGCFHASLTGLNAANVGLDVISTAMTAAPVRALGTKRKTNRLDKLISAARRKLDGLSEPQVTGTKLKSKVRKRQKRAQRKVKRFLRLVERGIRKGKMQRDTGWQLLDLGRATRNLLSEPTDPPNLTGTIKRAASLRSRPQAPPTPLSR